MFAAIILVQLPAGVFGKAGEKRKNSMNTETIRKIMENCRLCPRNCGVNRLEGRRGFCGADAKIRAARAALHMWEEPCISGREGSGALFFSGCSLGCVFCQNRSISRGERGKEVSPQRLAEIMLKTPGAESQ